MLYSIIWRIFSIDIVFYDEFRAYNYALDKNREYLLEMADDSELDCIMKEEKLNVIEKLEKFISLYDYSNGNMKYQGTVHSAEIV